MLLLTIAIVLASNTSTITPNTPEEVDEAGGLFVPGLFTRLVFLLEAIFDGDGERAEVLLEGDRERPGADLRDWATMPRIL